MIAPPARRLRAERASKNPANSEATRKRTTDDRRQLPSPHAYHQRDADTATRHHEDGEYRRRQRWYWWGGAQLLAEIFDACPTAGFCRPRTCTDLIVAIK